MDFLDENIRRKVTDLYLQVEYLKKLYYYYDSERDDDNIRRFLSSIEVYIKKLETLFQAIEEIKIDQITELEVSIDAFFDELYEYLQKYRAADSYKIFSFNYFV
jgi:hypothetical protein